MKLLIKYLALSEFKAIQTDTTSVTSTKSTSIAPIAAFSALDREFMNLRNFCCKGDTYSFKEKGRWNMLLIMFDIDGVKVQLTIYFFFTFAIFL